jgi:hypothetical protein
MKTVRGCWFCACHELILSRSIDRMVEALPCQQEFPIPGSPRSNPLWYSLC